MYSHILISTDGSDLAQHGVDHGLSLAKALGSKVTVVTATRPKVMPSVSNADSWMASSTDFAKYDDHQRKVANGILSAVKASAEKMGISAAVVHATDTFPAPGIVDTALKHGCDLIVMASHGRRGLKRALLGSQTSEVLALTKIPVLVVR